MTVRFTRQPDPDLPIGSHVLAFPRTRDDRAAFTVTRTEPWRLGDGTLVVAVEGFVGGIALNHIEVIPDE